MGPRRSSARRALVRAGGALDELRGERAELAQAEVLDNGARRELAQQLALRGIAIGDVGCETPAKALAAAKGAHVSSPAVMRARARPPRGRRRVAARACAACDT